jgi:DNA-binding CsgD family transcriptional regulator
MSVELTISVVSAVVALASAIIAALLGARAGRQQLELRAEIEKQGEMRRRQEQREDLMSRIRDPLLQAAFDLQMRIFNIVDQGFLTAYLLHGSDEERVYAMRSTVFVFAQYLGWIEIVRSSVRFLDLGDRKDNRELVNCFSKATGILSSDSFPDRSSNSSPDALFRVFRADQRAIGEIMIDTPPSGELACIGYAEFSSRMDSDASFARWLTSLSASAEELSKADDPAHPRLVAMQHNLIDLIQLLDPDDHRFPDRHRTRLVHSPLTQRETEMLGSLASGRSVSDVAEQLQISDATAGFRLWTLAQKLGTRTAAESIEIAKRRGWLRSSP